MGDEHMALMAGKQGLIMGVANDRSLAWGIAKAAYGEGARLAFTYQGEALGRRREGVWRKGPRRSSRPAAS
jgi:enoyl-[acyl-carrier-protein] reductase (NADH)